MVVRSLALAAFLAAALAAPAAADTILVTLDQARIVRLAAPAGTIVIGNPSIADATLQDNQTLVITGRSYGATNLLILDDAGQPIADDQLKVQAPTDTVTVYRGAQRVSLSCLPTCQPTVVPGDSTDAFTAIQSQSAARAGSATGQAAATVPATTGAPD